MSLFCRLFGHSWRRYELNPHREGFDGYQTQCRWCEAWGEVERPGGDG